MKDKKKKKNNFLKGADEQNEINALEEKKNRFFQEYQYLIDCLMDSLQHFRDTKTTKLTQILHNISINYVKIKENSNLNPPRTPRFSLGKVYHLNEISFLSYLKNNENKNAIK